MPSLSRAKEVLEEDGVLGLLQKCQMFVTREGINTYIMTHSRLKKAYYERFDHGVTDMMAEDWDLLLILDACRHDLFEEANTIPGDFSYRISPGSSTSEFLDTTIVGENFHDTVYITANPQHVKKDIRESFYDIIPVWKTNWDKSLRTVHPQSVVEAALDANKRYPNKRLLIHFMQPHYPFIGGKNKQIDEQRGSSIAGDYHDLKTEGLKTVWEKLEDGDLSYEAVWKGYKNNLELVLPHVQEIADKCEGKSVVTSDHGNLLGEFVFSRMQRIYAHPNSLHVPNLVKVPWLEIPYERRRKVVSEPPRNSPNHEKDNTAVQERLQDLGYTG